ncbi:hypothetical protein AB0I28_23225 [Phytomonospora sp. NPDC050363]|uniref:hypothetical protein n=1 Tax=Phytomonospora sp. NPDC050363 TaxID=3155642 RepID=UPI0033E7D9CB
MPSVNREWAAYWRSLLAWHVNNPHDDMCACGDRSTDCRIRRVAVKKNILRDITENLDHMNAGPGSGL